MSALVLIEREGAIATLTLNRVERHNSLVPEFLRAMLDALDVIKQSDARVAILQANGGSFSTGGDVRAFFDHRDDIVAYSNEIVGLLNQVIGAMIALPIPIVGAVHGIVTGGSLGLVL
ncbi:MAG: enoyl-CoA hydratase/isomerase family protein, partial [Anaerolineales bacterium]|nr:enoyl-CoA hydratase/isomerase family protein [Anaerolineales bacterium]